MSTFEKEQIASRVPERLKRKIVNVPLPTYGSFYGKPLAKSVAKRKLNYATDDVLFLFFGRVTTYKGIPELVTTFNTLREPRLRLAVVGTPSDPELARSIVVKVRELRDARIRAELTRVADDEVRIWLSACDWVVLPYRSILNSSSAMIGLTYGRPLIVPRMGALTELVEGQYQAGLLFEGGSLESLHAVLERASQMEPEDRERLAKHAEAVAADLTPEKISQRMKRVYEGLL